MRAALLGHLNRTVRADLDANARFHQEAGLPGNADAFLVLYLAMTGLLLDHFTLPGMLTGGATADRDLDRLVETIVTRIIPTE